MERPTAFTVPVHSDCIRRTATKPLLCPQRPASTSCRPANFTMKKVARGKKSTVMEDDSNAVDIFGGNVSPEDLLAAALADEPKKVKKSKKKKKGTVVTEDSSSPDAEASINEGQDENENVQKAKEQKQKKNGVISDDSNAVDVFGGSVDPEQLLADAMSSNGAAKSSSKSKKKRKKGAILSNDSNAVDVFGGNVNPEQLLSEAMGESEMAPAIPKSKKKGKRGKSIADVAEPVIAETPVEEPAASDDVKADDSSADDNEEIEIEAEFEPDEEVVSEFESLGDELADFTLDGRRKKSKKEKEKKVRSTLAVDARRSNLGYGSGGEKFTSVRLDDISVTFRDNTILRGVSWSVSTGERVGLVGENGCGKTTQLKIIAGLLKPNEGEVISASARTKCAFLRQEFVDELDPRRTLAEEFSTAFEKEYEALDEYKKIEKEVADAGTDMEKLEELLNKLEDARLACEDLDAWNLETRIDKVMPGLGFVPDDKDKLVASFSGGWKVRIGLGKVLLKDPDLLLLDEPSNHLDHNSVEWLEQFLQQCALPMVIVSHDREFLDRVATKIVEIEGGEAVSYPGNYTSFVKLKVERRKAWEAAYERQQKFISEQRAYINRFKRTPARITQVKSRQKMLERMEKTGQLVRRPPHGGKPLVFRFPPAPRSGRDVVIIDDVKHGYGDDMQLFKNACLQIERGDRIAIVGPNGSGKSTLLRMITGAEKPQEGAVECKELKNVSIAYYEQNQADALDLDRTVMETIREAASSDYRYQELRALLGKFLFKGDSVEKKVGALSGGEKARLALAKIMLKPANLLVLDEPGNHLSISAKEMLEEALQHFDGTLVIVSHDRYLLSQVAQQIVAVEDKELVLYDGDYKSYMEQNEELNERLRARFIPGVAEIKNAPKVVAEQTVDIPDKKMKRKKNFGGSGVGSGRVKEMNAKRWKK